MPKVERRRELGRGERLMPGIWRLRLPLPYPGVPHCNAWAVAAGPGIVLFDCGMHEAGSLAHIERAMAQVNLRLDLVRLLVCTHAHNDHYGQAADVIDASGCELWMHPDHAHATGDHGDPSTALARRLEVARHSGVPDDRLRRYAESVAEEEPRVTRIVEQDRDLVDGVVIETDLGPWHTYETPGHCPSHVCLFQPDYRLLISGDHLLGRVSPYWDFGFSPDPTGEFLRSLDVVDGLDARLAIPGHGRTFTDVAGHIRANRTWVVEHLDAVEAVVRERGPITVYDAVPIIYGEPLNALNASWRMNETLCYFRHLEVTGRIAGDGGEPELWATFSA